MPPVITLTGDSNKFVDKGLIYRDFGAVAVDNFDGNLTAGITVESNVNTGAVGKYYVSYAVRDSSGNIFFVRESVDLPFLEGAIGLGFN